MTQQINRNNYDKSPPSFNLEGIFTVTSHHNLALQSHL
jgi:hypothetical protein